MRVHVWRTWTRARALPPQHQGGHASDGQQARPSPGPRVASRSQGGETACRQRATTKHTGPDRNGIRHPEPQTSDTTGLRNSQRVPGSAVPPSVSLLPPCRAAEAEAAPEGPAPARNGQRSERPPASAPRKPAAELTVAAGDAGRHRDAADRRPEQRPRRHTGPRVLLHAAARPGAQPRPRVTGPDVRGRPCCGREAAPAAPAETAPGPLREDSNGRVCVGTAAAPELAAACRLPAGGPGRSWESAASAPRGQGSRRRRTVDEPTWRASSRSRPQRSSPLASQALGPGLVLVPGEGTAR